MLSASNKQSLIEKETQIKTQGVFQVFAKEFAIDQTVNLVRLCSPRFNYQISYNALKYQIAIYRGSFD